MKQKRIVTRKNKIIIIVWVKIISKPFKGGLLLQQYDKLVNSICVSITNRNFPIFQSLELKLYSKYLELEEYFYDINLNKEIIPFSAVLCLLSYQLLSSFLILCYKQYLSKLANIEEAKISLTMMS